MSLRAAHLLLIAGPALVFAFGGSCVAQRSHAGLGPELDRHAAGRASELVRRERRRLQVQLRESRLRLAESSLELAIERFTVYDSIGEVGTFPVDSAAVPLRIEPEHGEAMLAAARRGHTVVDLARFEGRSVWLAYVPLPDALAAVLLTPDSLLADRFRNASGYDLALYYDDARVPPAEGSWPHELPVALRDSLADLDRPLSVHMAGAFAAAAPVKDFDDWNVVGAVMVRRTDLAPSVPALPLLSTIAMFLAAAFSGILLARRASNRVASVASSASLSCRRPSPQLGWRHLTPVSPHEPPMRGWTSVHARPHRSPLPLLFQLAISLSWPEPMPCCCGATRSSPPPHRFRTSH